ncbi:MAG TPA: carboxymuconolactone decarboxylase family protein, partial [Bacteroidetes bacterium]|nr:carboxymuconolactone decarboxylase family protein [Bacteroidota bacterium]
MDSQVYRPGALPSKTKELLGLVASLALRCDDCVEYHLNQCRDAGVTDSELNETLAVGLIVGGGTRFKGRAADKLTDGLP